MDALFQNDSGTLPERPAALQSVPVNALQRHSTALHGAAHSEQLANDKDPLHRGDPSSHFQWDPRTHNAASASSSASGRGGHRRSASHAPGRGNGSPSGSHTSRPAGVSHAHSKSTNAGRGVITRRPAWGLRTDSTVAAKRELLQSIRSTYSVSAHNRSMSLRSNASVGGGSVNSAHSMRSKSGLHTGGSLSTGAGGTGSASARASPAAHAQHARAGAKLASEAGRGAGFGTPPVRAGRSSAPRAARALGARRPYTAQPASSTASPLQALSSLSASQGGGGGMNSSAAAATAAASGSKLPSGIALHSNATGSKLRSGTSAASIRSTASGSSRIAAVPAHAVSKLRAPSRGGSTSVGNGATRAGTHSNSSSAAQLRQNSYTHGSINISDNLFASVDHSHGPDNLSDVLSSEIVRSPTGLSDFGSATAVNPFLPMFPAALGVEIFPGLSDNPEKGGMNDEPAPLGGKIFPNVPDGNGLEVSKLAHSSSQFVRGKLAAGISSPAPKGSSSSSKQGTVVAAQMHDVHAPAMHDDVGSAAAQVMTVRDDMHVYDVSARLANPQVLPPLLYSISTNCRIKCTYLLGLLRMFVG